MRPPDPQYLKLLAPYGKAIQDLALAARTLILQEAPAASEFIYEVYTIADHFALNGTAERRIRLYHHARQLGQPRL